MSDDTLKAPALPEVNPKDLLIDHLTQLARANGLRRVVAMDKIYVVNRDERPYFTRFMTGGGEYQEDGGGFCKGHATPGMVIRETQHHCVAYINVHAFLAEAQAIGYNLTYAMRRQLEATGVLYVTNGMENRLPWVVQVNRKLQRLVFATNGPRQCDRIDHEARMVKVGDWLECFEYKRVQKDGWSGGHYNRQTMEAMSVRSDAYAKERYRFLDTLT